MNSLYNNLDPRIRRTAKIILLPVAISSGIVYGIDNKTGMPVPFTFSRASSATLFDTDKNMQLVGNDVPRIDYGNYSDSAKLLIEKESTNYVRDNDFNLGLDISGANYTLIDDAWKGAVLANKSAQLSSGLGATSFYYKRISNLQDKPLTFSIFYRNDENQKWINGGLANGDGLFNISNFQSSVQYINTLIKEGIYRISRSGSTSTPASFGYAKPTITLARNSYVIGYQIEDGEIMTSYIPTSGSQITRSADLLSINLQAASTIYLKTTTQETTLQKPAGLYNIHEDLNNEGIEVLAIMN